MTDAPRPHDAPYLGIDIGGTKLAAGVATADGELLSAADVPAEAEEGPDAMIRRATDLASEVARSAGLATAEVAGIGIACGGPLDPWRGVVLNALNNPGWINVPLVARVTDALGAPAVLENDANAAAVGEHRFGAGRGVDDLIYLTISTGIGGGVILGGRLEHGASGNAGELGHISVRVQGGRRCHCGSIGCLEAYCSGTNIAARAVEALDRERGGALAGIDPRAVTAKLVVDAARDGDALARRIWDETVELLGGGIASMIHAFNPSLVILGGGVTRAGDILFEPLRKVVEERTMPWLAESVTIAPAGLGERTGVLGAVAVAVDRVGRVPGGRREVA